MLGMLGMARSVGGRGAAFASSLILEVAPVRRSTLYVRSIVLLNYHLHKLFVLSIFYPLRKMTLGDKHQRADDRKELLASSRIVLQLQSAAMEIWSNWDLVVGRALSPAAP